MKKRWEKKLGSPSEVNVITGERKDRTNVVLQKSKCSVSLTLTEKLPSCTKKSVTATKKWWGAEFGRNCEKNTKSAGNQPEEHEDQNKDNKGFQRLPHN